MDDIRFSKQNTVVHIVDPQGALKLGENVLKKQFCLAISRIQKKQHIKNVDYVVFSSPKYRTIPTLGFGAYTIDKNVVIVNIDPYFKGFPRSLEKELTHMIAHETAHVIRIRKGRTVSTLFDAFVSEGLADCFGEEICLYSTDLWHQKYYKSLDIPYDLAKKNSNKKLVDYGEWFTVGNPKLNIPWTAGYAMGKKIIKEYLASHPDVSPSQILELDSKEFLPSFKNVLKKASHERKSGKKHR